MGLLKKHRRENYLKILYTPGLMFYLLTIFRFSFFWDNFSLKFLQLNSAANTFQKGTSEMRSYLATLGAKK